MSTGGGSATGANGVFVPPGQSGAAASLLPQISPMAAQGAQGLNTLGGNTPAGYAWPYVSGTTSNILNNPYASGAIAGAGDAASIFQNQFLPSTFSTSPSLMGLGSLAAGQAGGVPGMTYGNPAYGQAGALGGELAQLFGGGGSPVGGFGAAGDFAGAQPTGGFGAAGDFAGAPTGGFNPVSGALGYAFNPTLAQATQAGAGLAPGFLSGAGALEGLAVNNPAVTAAQRYGQDTAEQLIGTGEQIQNAAFDPQQALYQRTQQQLQDQTNVNLANSGVASTPYGQSVLGNTLGNFNIDWQNNLLNREIQGGQAASGLYGQGLSQLLNPIQEQIANAQGMGGAASGLANAGLNLFTEPSLAQGTALGQGVNAATTLGNTALQSLLGPANAQTVAALQGTNALGNLTNTAGGAYGGALGELSSLMGAAPGALGAPYNAYNQIQGNNFGALQNEISLGNQNYTVPQQVIGDLSQYLGLGQNASGLANTIGSTNFNQLAQGAGGVGQLLGGANSLFGGGGGGGLGGFGSSLFGSPFTSSVGAAPAGSMFAAENALGGAGSGALGASSDVAANLAPLAFLGS